MPNYRGRFAPSPTGPLHFGSLIAAVGSYLAARSRQGEWLLRIEDIDPPRESPGAVDAIQRALDAFGFEWDGPILFQSRRNEAYIEALEQLQHAGLSYRCNCSRKTISEDAQRAGRAAVVYGGHCLQHPPPAHQPAAIRLRCDSTTVRFRDALQGNFTQNVAYDVGDFVLRRADGLFAYQLAVVVDDAAQGITDVVRGSDLLDNTPRQLLLQQALGMSCPNYLHLPVATGRNGKKLSKQNHARPLDEKDPVPALWQALNFLGQRPERMLQQSTLSELWQWALENWREQWIPAQLTRCETAGDNETEAQNGEQRT